MESLFIRALSGQRTERAPVWLMRQAGRYLPEYRAIKEQHGFLEMCEIPELAIEISLQPIRRFGVDAAIIFSDILLPLRAMGLEVEFNPGPRIHNPISTAAEASKLSAGGIVHKLKHVLQAIAGLKTALSETHVPVIGFAGAPWTLACYSIAQQEYKHFQGTQVWACQNERAADRLLTLYAETVSDYLLAQIESGASAVQLFDTWAGNLSIEDYRRFALPPTQLIVERVQQSGRPLILYVNGSSHLLPAMRESGATCLSVDWRTPLGEAAMGWKGSLQGNFDPSHLFKPTDYVTEATARMLRSVNAEGAYIANLGHGVLPRTPIENVQAFVNTVKCGWPKSNDNPPG